MFQSQSREKKESRDTGGNQNIGKLFSKNTILPSPSKVEFQDFRLEKLGKEFFLLKFGWAIVLENDFYGKFYVFMENDYFYYFP